MKKYTQLIFSAGATIISSIAMVISLISLFVTLKNNRDLLSLQEANIVVENVAISLSQENCNPNDNKKICQIVIPKIKNIGHASARNTSVEFWECSLDEKIKLTDPNDKNHKDCIQ